MKTNVIARHAGLQALPQVILGTLLVAGTFATTLSAQTATPNFGPNVIIFDPTTPASQVLSTLTSISNED
jgi:hypothetical protein